ncbi:glycine cleavage system aminomethyltransferase GcvT [Corynebacterium gerontici]|uniref:Aminomethyltransferase n=1 Tax=Corynebacterium gerontici TaxID=2079234 RepID=A0A3G6J5T6_9CORY|nr:glycine cleavage system aminomethyltransferase GcvT [Corynebacterium gerontici]AZA11810.1 Aminomethyltransferase [Corynebacterium gerontici]
MSELLQSPLHEIHEELGASFTPFGAWNMPLKYGSELAEHRAVRESCGIFDLSHMGEVRVTGPDAAAFLDFALVSQLSALKVGKAKYSMIVNYDGGIIDDLISYRLGEEEFLVVPNAGNAETVFKEFQQRSKDFDVELVDESRSTALIAVQGPNSAALVEALVQPEDAEKVQELSYYAAIPLVVAGHRALLARTGYTGEDGFELYIPNEEAADLWRAISTMGEDFGLTPCGLAARDSLRLEAGMPLYGNELSLQRTPADAGLRVLVSKKKEGDFVGKDAMLGAAEPQQLLVGLSSEQRRAARHGAALFVGDQQVGEVTSGQPSPTLGHPIALAYVDREHTAEGTQLEADVRGKRLPFRVAALPFYRRAK